MGYQVVPTRHYIFGRIKLYVSYFLSRKYYNISALNLTTHSHLNFYLINLKINACLRFRTKTISFYFLYISNCFKLFLHLRISVKPPSTPQTMPSIVHLLLLPGNLFIKRNDNVRQISVVPPVFVYK